MTKTIVLPLPETTNQIYRSSSRGWYKSEKQKVWEERAGYIVKAIWGKQKQLEGEISMSIRLFYEYNRDIDGSLKPILDLFQRMGVYKNDSQITSLTVDKFSDKDNPRVEVTIL